MCLPAVPTWDLLTGAPWPEQAPLELLAAGRPVMAASVEVSGTEVAELRLIDQDSFYPTLEAAGDKLVVVDFYTAW